MYAPHPSITKGKLAGDTVRFANAMVVFPNAEILSMSCLGGTSPRVRTWRLEGNILRKAEDGTEDCSDDSYYTMIIPHIRSALQLPSRFANENGDLGVPVRLYSRLKSISTADGLGDLHLKHLTT